MADKLQVGIYRLDTEVSACQDLAALRKHLSVKEYAEQTLAKAKLGGFRLALFYQRYSTTPKWKGLLRDLLKSGQVALKPSQTRTESFVLVLAHQTSKSLYAVAGGQGYFAIHECIDSNFGIDVISRLIGKDDRLIKGTKETSFVGTIIGTAKQFRKDYSLRDSDTFGGIYRELDTVLERDALVKHFGFTPTTAKNGSVCYAKGAFRLSKAITLQQLFEIVRGCETVLTTLPATTVNSAEKVSKSKEATLIAKLDAALHEQLWERFQKGDKYEIDFDVCHRDVELYLTAATHVVRRGASTKELWRFDRLDNVDLLFEKVRTSGEKFASGDEFGNYLDSLKVLAYDENETELTSGTFLRHLHGDVLLTGRERYFCIDGTWYRISADFVQELNDACESFVRGNTYTGLSRTWDTDKQTENEYSKQYIGASNTIVLDRITPQNIEACDILKWDAERLYLIHLKRGFDNRMRELCSQVSVAANRLVHERTTGKEDFIGALYDCLKSGSASPDPYLKAAAAQCTVHSRPTFLDLFKKKLVFVVAARDTGTTVRSLAEPTKFRSNIAKFSLQELIREIRAADAELQIAEVK